MPPRYRSSRFASKGPFRPASTIRPEMVRKRISPFDKPVARGVPKSEAHATLADAPRSTGRERTGRRVEPVDVEHAQKGGDRRGGWEGTTDERHARRQVHCRCPMRRRTTPRHAFEPRDQHVFAILREAAGHRRGDRRRLSIGADAGPPPRRHSARKDKRVRRRPASMGCGHGDDDGPDSGSRCRDSGRL